MSELVKPTPLKMNDGISAMDMAWQYILEVRENFLLEKEDTNNLEKFVRYMGVLLIVKTREIRNSEQYFITGVDGSRVDLGTIAGKQGTEISKQNKIEAMEGIAQFFYALIRLFYAEKGKSNSLENFIKWAQTYFEQRRKN